MKRIFQKLSVLTAVSLLGFGVMKTDSAQAATFNFTQGGFEGGGTLSGTFTGEDLNNDGFIGNGVLSDNELSDFSLSFSGNSIITDSATASLSNLTTFRYAIGSPQGFSDSAGGGFSAISIFLPGNRILIIGSGRSVGVVGGGGVTSVTVFSNTGSIANRVSSNQPVQVSEVTSKSVPEPNISAVAGLTVLGLSAFLKRRRVAL